MFRSFFFPTLFAPVLCHLPLSEGRTFLFLPPCSYLAFPVTEYHIHDYITPFARDEYGDPLRVKITSGAIPLRIKMFFEKFNCVNIRPIVSYIETHPLLYTFVNLAKETECSILRSSCCSIYIPIVLGTHGFGCASLHLDLGLPFPSFPSRTRLHSFLQPISPCKLQRKPFGQLVLAYLLLVDIPPIIHLCLLSLSLLQSP